MFLAGREGIVVEVVNRHSCLVRWEVYVEFEEERRDTAGSRGIA